MITTITAKREAAIKELQQLEERRTHLIVMIQTYDDLIKTQTDLDATSGKPQEAGSGE